MVPVPIFLQVKLKLQLSEAEEEVRRLQDSMDSQSRTLAMLDLEKLDLMEVNCLLGTDFLSAIFFLPQIFPPPAQLMAVIFPDLGTSLFEIIQSLFALE